MIVNWHAHTQPPEEAEKQTWPGGNSPLFFARLLEAQEKNGIDMAVVTNPIHYLKGRSDAECLKAIQRWDEYAVEIESKHKAKVVCFASTIPGGGPDFLKELERAIRDYKLHGVFINSSHHGHYPDEDNARGFFELVTALDIPCFIHAPASSFGEEVMRMYRLISSIGRPADESLAIARMIVRGVWEDFPTFKLVGAHLGGGIIGFIGRMDYAYEYGEAGNFLGSYEPKRIRKKPSEYLKMTWMDSVSYFMPALKCAIECVGVDRMLFGADAPPMVELIPWAIQLINDLPLSQRDRDAIFSQNALKLLNRS